MTPERVYERFIQEFPNMKPLVDRWYTMRTNSGKSIRILLKTKKSLIFTVQKDGTWTLK